MLCAVDNLSQLLTQKKSPIHAVHENQYTIVVISSAENKVYTVQQQLAIMDNGHVEQGN